MRFKSIGRLRYSPLNNGKIHRRDGGTTNWWVVIDVDPEIGRYYRELFRIDNYKSKTIQRPAWGAHISVVANEIPSNLKSWKKYDHQLIEFEYFHDPKDNDIYHWLPVICDQALELRQELGLIRNPFYPLHLTVGNSK